MDASSPALDVLCVEKTLGHDAAAGTFEFGCMRNGGSGGSLAHIVS